MKGLSRKICLMLACVLAVFGGFSTPVSAYTQKDLDEVNVKISELRSQIAEYEEQASALAEEADSLQRQIAILQNDQATLRTQIDLKQAEHDQLVIDIETVQKRIQDNSDTIGYVIAEYFYNSDVSTVERLASSDSFASFVDKEVQYTSISDTLADIVTENKALKVELIAKKKEAEAIIEDLSNQKAQLAAKEKEQAELLARTQANEYAYRQLRNSSVSEKSALEEEQQKILQELATKYSASGVTAGDPSKGGYPYSGRCPQQKDAFSDPWGMYVCECVSYAAWRVYNAYGYMPYWGGRGNANQWLANARAAGYTVTSTPKAGAVGISNSGPWGHAVWVEYVTNGGKVHISQYNARNEATGWRSGEYSEQDVLPGAYTYIYFDSK